MDQNKQGLALLDKSDAAGALVCFTRALIEHPTSPDYYSNRSKAFARLRPPHHDLALQDAEYALLYARSRGKRDKIADAQLRRAVSLFSSGRYVAAGQLIDLVYKDEKQKMLHMWKIKVEQKLQGVPESERPIDPVEEFPNVEPPQNGAASKWFKRQINNDGTFNFGVAAKFDTTENEVAEVDTSGKTEEEGMAQGSTNIYTVAQTAGPIAVRQDWFQTSSTVTISLFAKGVDKEKFSSEIKEDSVYVSFPQPGNPSSEYSFSLDPLCGAIDSSKSKVSVLKTKIEIVLQKTSPIKWKTLEGTEKPSTNGESTAIPPTEAVKPKETAPSYPTSSRKGPKNWDKVADDLTKKAKPAKKRSDSDSEPDDGDDIDGDESGDDVDNFFKKLYKGSDADTQRAMMKSYQESGGTTLSTNWEDVGSKRVEPYKSADDD